VSDAGVRGRRPGERASPAHPADRVHVASPAREGEFAAVRPQPPHPATFRSCPAGSASPLNVSTGIVDTVSCSWPTAAADPGITGRRTANHKAGSRCPAWKAKLPHRPGKAAGRLLFEGQRLNARIRSRSKLMTMICGPGPGGAFWSKAARRWSTRIAEIQRLSRLGLYPWVTAADRPFWIRIRPTPVTGRHTPLATNR
jgi:hypothetical protein